MVNGIKVTVYSANVSEYDESLFALQLSRVSKGQRVRWQAVIMYGMSEKPPTMILRINAANRMRMK